jgi:hypothetical protein
MYKRFEFMKNISTWCSFRVTPWNFYKDLNLLIKRTPYHECDGSFFQKNRSTIALAIVIFLSAFFIRSWQSVLNPGLYMEDASHYFNVHYGGGHDLSFILQQPNGYYNILSSFTAWCASECDVRWQPMIYNIIGLIMGTITATCFLFTGLLRNRCILIVTPLVLGLSGMNHIYYFNTITYQIYNVVVILLCLLFFPVTRSKLALFFLCFVAAILVWSGPYSVVALPISLALLVFFKNRSKTILIISIMINVVLYTLSVREGTIRLSNILDEEMRRYAIEVLFEKIFFMDLLGKISFTKVGIFFLVLASILYFLRKDVFFIKISITLFMIILCVLAPFFLSIKYILYRTVLPCHIYISQFFWLCFILFTVDHLLNKISPRISAKLAIIGFFFAFVLIDNASNPSKGKEKIMTNIPLFVQTIHLVEQLELEKKGQYVMLQTENVMPGFLPSIVRVGSKNLEATRLNSKDVPIHSGKEFIVD